MAFWQYFRGRTSAILVLLALMALARAAAANERQQQEGAALIEKARELSNLKSSGSQPYRLRMHVRYVSAEGAKEGTYSELWASNTQWRREIHLPGFSQIEVGNGEKRWILRGGDLKLWKFSDPLPIREIALKLPERTRISKVRSEEWQGQHLRCVVTRAESWPERTYCFDDAGGALRTVHEHKTVSEYADYAAAGTKSFPRTMRVWNANQITFEATVEELTSGVALDSELFVPPAGAVAWANCDDLDFPKPLSTPDPSYPPAERKAHREGMTTLYVVVETNGHTRDIAILDSAGQGFDEAATASVAKWRFRPAMCHGVPVAYEMSIEVTFQIRF